MARKTKRKTIKRKSSQEKNLRNKFQFWHLVLTISALVLNILLPGLGSIIAGRIKTGIYQLVLIALALIAAIFIPGWIVFCILWAIAWIWGIVTGVQLIKS